MNQKGFTAPLIILGTVILIVVAAGVFYISKQVSAPKPQFQNQAVISQNTPNSNTPPIQISPSPILDEMALCVKDKQERFGQNKYEEGYLLVGFKTTSKEEAQSIIKSYGLDFDPSYNSRGIQPLTLYVKVPKGEEFKWICKLDNDLNIQDVSLNFLFGF